jgi:hypothetical protein
MNMQDIPLQLHANHVSRIDLHEYCMQGNESTSFCVILYVLLKDFQTCVHMHVILTPMSEHVFLSCIYTQELNI